MSTSTQTPTNPAPPAAQKITPPTQILNTTIAKLYSTIHPLVLLILVTVRFDALVQDPISELLNDLPFLVGLQLLFVVLCLPPAGADEKHDPVHKSKAGIRRRVKTDAVGGVSGIVAGFIPGVLSLILTTLLATPVLTLLLVLFGAPATTHHAQTVLAGAHMAVLASPPLIYVHGVDGSVWREVWGANRPGDVVWGGALGTCVGAWFGAVPVPLDWDRPWQAFPITVLVGAYIGYAVGVWLGGSVLFGRRLKIEEDEDLDLDSEVEGKKTE
ncbi:GPI biosynthesis protein family Pig-F-domain-containing protein [Aspergillus avenaceus]|uniref:GPI biosynthesis protein family Pig-F-domain-containing protein n=1 Tax=Aspergillus avenaceus TaxID=36643 RepID=A0A5N6TX26_ASPAV|nr:GPI biosynthesis protein family Pig-F-domain-containing protein [Aspergillus avenaceus]